jgi:hypothetical protein
MLFLLLEKIFYKYFILFILLITMINKINANKIIPYR